MKVPGSFELGGRTWSVTLVDELHDDKGKLIWGVTYGDRCQIELRRTDDEDQLEHTFWHELVHAICFTIGYPKLNHDENRVDAIGGMLMQFHKTKEGKA